MGISLTTDRLLVREWTPDDAEDALAVYGSTDVARWLTPVMDQVVDAEAMRSVLRGWEREQAGLLSPRGRWAVERREDGKVVGGLGIRPLPPYDEDLEITWQLSPQDWGQGYATEAGLALLRWVFTQDIEEVFAVARPKNDRAHAVAKRLGMRWVGETTKYYGLNLQVYRIRPADLPGDRF
ncbi:RimJ/RimL family protein N-acetyltransferase [Kitasatospora sp. SolWspMP-SS2h]|uniref:GNAT family N-acetyltransferase n=1 Tax=Kitasatospora sp. SolWspMP-SS2h TaxID=1305729 RepID=UPI000DBA4729|nr:GNAT family N-acetyltransferase [Kitasatospora sp. SolWspMP-SS2h]RAJ36870.1 RimJ/RimL family protein N-acetyltransferase [Kitasatospora sp. SolWspMP-SS2h]